LQVTICHNPRCATSRATLALLRRRRIEPMIVESLRPPPTRSGLEILLRQLGMAPRDLLRTREPEFRRAGLDDPKRSRSAILSAMIKHPQLIQRPIVVVNNKRAALGRPPENVLAILTPT
jgi:arsenate reductase (glutaredoxin)